jgi:hypothetical protein
MTYTGKLYGRLGGAFIETGLHTSDVAELTAAVRRLEAENKALRNAIAALMPFLMEDYDCGVMTVDYKAAIELAIAAHGTEAQHAS